MDIVLIVLCFIGIIILFILSLRLMRNDISFEKCSLYLEWIALAAFTLLIATLVLVFA